MASPTLLRGGKTPHPWTNYTTHMASPALPRGGQTPHPWTSYTTHMAGLPLPREVEKTPHPWINYTTHLTSPPKSDTGYRNGDKAYPILPIQDDEGDSNL